jgi:phosphoglucosamine mutase
VIRLLAGRDTRESGGWIERELAFGIRSQGGTLTSAGIIPTPAVAYLTPRLGYAAGVVISASHNPFEDNGIKVFSGAGEKFTEVLERTCRIDGRRRVVVGERGRSGSCRASGSPL